MHTSIVNLESYESNLNDKINFNIGVAIYYNNIKYILTTAHGINDKVYSSQYKMTLVSLCKDFELALLVPDDNKFWTTVKAISLISLTEYHKKIESKITVFIINSMITACSIDDYIKIKFAQISNVVLHVNTDLNIDFSGSPLVDRKNNLLGICYDNKNKYDLAILLFTILRFLKEISLDGICAGSCYFHLKIANLQNPTFRTNLCPYSHPIRSSIYIRCDNIKFKKYDVIYKIDGQEILNDGTIYIDHIHKVPFWYLFNMKLPDDICSIEYIQKK